VMGGPEPAGFRKLRYKLWRGLVPHKAPNPEVWMEAVRGTR